MSKTTWRGLRCCVLEYDDVRLYRWTTNEAATETEARTNGFIPHLITGYEKSDLGCLNKAYLT